MPNLAAVIQQTEYLTIPNSKNYVAWVYDKDRPRDIDAEDPKARYACVDMLGPFRTLEAAVRACNAAGITDDQPERIGG